MWGGTDGNGIYIVRNEEIVAHVTSNDGLVGNIIFKIMQDSDGSFWICTGTGITRCHAEEIKKGIPTEFQIVNSESGLGTDSVFQMIDDRGGNFWLTSNYGVSSLKRAELLDVAVGKTGLFNTKFFSYNDGLDSAGRLC